MISIRCLYRSKNTSDRLTCWRLKIVVNFTTSVSSFPSQVRSLPPRIASLLLRRSRFTIRRQDNWRGTMFSCKNLSSKRSLLTRMTCVLSISIDFFLSKAYTSKNKLFRLLFLMQINWTCRILSDPHRENRRQLKVSDCATWIETFWGNVDRNLSGKYVACLEVVLILLKAL